MKLWDKMRTADPIAMALIACAVVLGIVWFMTKPAKAADKGGEPLSFLPIGEVASKSAWTGCGVSVSGAGIIGTASEGGPGIFADGQLASVGLTCDLQAGQMVFGGAAEYGWFFGDLSDIGVDTDITIRGRAGFLLSPSTLLFGHVAWSRIEGDGGHLDGWKFGPGVSIKLPNSPVFLDFRYDYGVWDVPGAGDVDVISHAGVVQLTYKFGSK